jgi:SAM-dependent methyltransferase
VAQFPGPGKYTIVTNYEDSYALDFLDQRHEFMYPERENWLQDIANRVMDLRPKGKILDVGCGDGQFLFLCTKGKMICHGVESNKKLSLYASSKTGAKISQGSYRKDMFPENSFDVVTFIQVLEHLARPTIALEAAKSHLRPGGILVVEVPSIHSPHFLAYQLTGFKWFVKPPTGVIYSHFGYYSPKTLSLLTAQCGFKKLSLITGRWQHRYARMKRMGKIIDPLLNAIKVGGILYFGIKE